MATPAFEEIVEDFEFLEDWEDRYRHVIDQGKAMPPLEDALRVPATKVDGCASQVWLHPVIEFGEANIKGTYAYDHKYLLVGIALLRTHYSYRSFEAPRNYRSWLRCKMNNSPGSSLLRSHTCLPTTHWSLRLELC